MEKGETWDGQRIFKQWLQKGIENLSASEVKRYVDSLRSAIAELDQKLREAKRSEQPNVRVNIPLLREEIGQAHSVESALLKRLEFFKKEQSELKNAKKKAAELEKQGREIFSKIEMKIGEVKGLVEQFRQVKGEAEKLVKHWHFCNWDKSEKPDEACSWLRLNDAKTLVLKALKKALEGE